MENSGYSGSLTVVAKDHDSAKLRRICEAARKAGKAPKAFLTCPRCETSEDFKGHPSIKEALIQIDEFRRAHSGCAKGQRNDERESTRGGQQA